ncbi:hypothetical protein JB92DRAFT_2833948 [Gautieria morchelliformis]|nr:hypothetical protein JB92DRAFT_2833948 [Gautieria morchelliformis]
MVDVKVVEEFVEGGYRGDEEEQAEAFLVEVEEVQEGAEVLVTTRSGLSSDKAPPVSQGRAPPQYSFKSKIEDPGLNDKALQEVYEKEWSTSVRQQGRRSLLVAVSVPAALPREGRLPQSKTAPVLPLREIDVRVGGQVIPALLDSRSSIVGIHEELAKVLGLVYDCTA